MARTLDVCIRGSGIVGLVVALLLARERLRIGLVAPAAGRADKRTDVRAYALNQQSKGLLEQLRCWPTAAHVTAVTAMHIRETGAAAVNFSAADNGVAALAWIVDVPALEAQLLEATRFQPQIQLLDAPQAAALTIVCEGQAGTSRQTFGADIDITPYPQWAIAARVDCDLPHAQAAWQWFAGRDVLALLPLGGDSGNSMAVVWSVHESRKAELMAASDDEFAEKLQVASDRQLGGVRVVSERAAWPLQLASARRWCGVTDGAAWVLAGDAAHTVHPLAGQGLNLGLADAQELAAQLHGRDYWRSVADQKTLRRFERARKADVAMMGMATDGLQQLFARAGPAWQGMRNWGMTGFEHSGLFKRWVARQAMGNVAAGSGVATTDGTGQA